MLEKIFAFFNRIKILPMVLFIPFLTALKKMSAHGGILRTIVKDQGDLGSSPALLPTQCAQLGWNKVLFMSVPGPSSAHPWDSLLPNILPSIVLVVKYVATSTLCFSIPHWLNWLYDKQNNSNSPSPTLWPYTYSELYSKTVRSDKVTFKFKILSEVIILIVLIIVTLIIVIITKEKASKPPEHQGFLYASWILEHWDLSCLEVLWKLFDLILNDNFALPTILLQ